MIRRAGVVEDAFALVGVATVGTLILGGAVSAGIIVGQAVEAWLRARRLA